MGEEEQLANVVTHSWSSLESNTAAIVSPYPAGKKFKH
jgi:hypothetical protein